MNIEKIAKFCESETLRAGSCIKIDMKSRNSILGYIIKGLDYEDLKSKNFWRVVLHNNMNRWQQNADFNMCKIYSGTEFVKLSVVPLPALMPVK